MFEQALRTISSVPRWSIARTINKQTVDGHSYFVTLYTLQLCKWLNLDDHTTLACLSRAIWHDQAEFGTGDSPGPAKRATTDKAKLKAYEKGLHERFFDGEGLFAGNALADRVVKVADLLDACMFLAIEYQMGNTVNSGPLLEQQRFQMNEAIHVLVQDNERFGKLSHILNSVVDQTCTCPPGWPDEPENK